MDDSSIEDKFEDKALPFVVFNPQKQGKLDYYLQSLLILL
jgi:hypothetical protein